MNQTKALEPGRGKLQMRRSMSSESGTKNAQTKRKSPRGSENFAVETSTTKVALPQHTKHSPRSGDLGRSLSGGGLVTSPRAGGLTKSPHGRAQVASPRGGDLSASQNSKLGALPPLVNVPANQQNYHQNGNNPSMLGLSTAQEQRARVEKEKIIKQRERDLLAEKAAAMVARAEREHSAMKHKAEEIKVKKEKEDREAVEKVKEANKTKDEGPMPRVFKKSSPNGKITTYLGKRDFIDHLQPIDDQGNTVDLIDGVVLVDPEYLKGRIVICRVLAAFRYGREDLDVLGLTFRKDLLQMKMQVYPAVEDGGETKKLSRLQERLIKKLGKNAYPFSFRLPPGAASSVTLQPAPGDTGKPCGVDYEMSTYVTEDADGKPHKRNSVRLAIRKLTYGPSPSEKKGDQPSAEVQHEFTFSPAPITLEVTLDKEMYYHGETIHVNVQITNNSNKRVKGIKIKILQIACICLFSQAEYKCPVASVEESIDVPRSSTFCRVYYLTPLLANNRDKRGLALDGQLKNEDTNLASSSILDNVKDKENLGIVVDYRAKVKLVMAGVGVTEPSLELPLKLTHPKPVEVEPSAGEAEAEKTATPADKPAAQQQQPPQQQQEVLDANLISFDTSPGQQKQLETEDDDLVFEDFARMRLKGYDGEDTQA